MALPDFTAEGRLPPGDYPMTLSELQSSMLVNGPPDPDENWHTSWRSELVHNLSMLVKQLWSVGITEIFIDGSFVEDKTHPNDIDGYFECDLQKLASGDLEDELNYLDAQKVWTWDPKSRRPYRGYAKEQLPMWHVYRVELYPHVPGTFTGITDEHGHNLEFPAAFRRARSDGQQRGIVKITKETT